MGPKEGDIGGEDSSEWNKSGKEEGEWEEKLEKTTKETGTDEKEKMAKSSSISTESGLEVSKEMPIASNTEKADSSSGSHLLKLRRDAHSVGSGKLAKHDPKCRFKCFTNNK